MVKLLETQSSIKATQTVKLINEFLCKQHAMISEEQRLQAIANEDHEIDF